MIQANMGACAIARAQWNAGQFLELNGAPQPFMLSNLFILFNDHSWEGF
jgi:hypothetical protein